MGLARQIRRLTKRKEEAAAKKRRKALIEPLEPRFLLDAVAIESEAANAISDGLTGLKDFAEDLEALENLGRNIPVVNQALGSALDISAIIENELLDPATGYLGTSNPDSAGLASALDSRDVLDVIDGSDTSTDPDTLLLDVLLNKTVTVTSEVDLGQGALDAGLFLEDSPALDLNAELTFDFLFGVDLTDNTFFIQVRDFSVTGSVDATLDFDLDIGFLETDVVDGTFFIDAGLDVAFTDPDTSDSGITLSELQTRPIDSLVAVSTVSSTLDVTLPVQASFLGLGVQPTVVVTAGGEFFGETPDVTVQDFETLYALDDALSAGFEALANFGDNLDMGDELGVKLPFFDTSLGEVADLGGLLSDTLLDPLNALLNSDDPRSADTLDGAITDALSNLGASGIQVTHNLVGDVLSFDVIFETERRAGVSLDFSSGDPEAGDQQGDLAAEMAELGLELNGEFTLDLVLDVGFDMTFGVDLTELP
ncbi:MAG: hypothetical protein JSU72_20285, partial [Deltaproteobacteria bacterium]